MKYMVEVVITILYLYFVVKNRHCISWKKGLYYNVKNKEVTALWNEKEVDLL